MGRRLLGRLLGFSWTTASHCPTGMRDLGFGGRGGASRRAPVLVSVTSRFATFFFFKIAAVGQSAINGLPLVERLPRCLFVLRYLVDSPFSVFYVSMPVWLQSRRGWQLDLLRISGRQTRFDRILGDGLFRTQGTHVFAQHRLLACGACRLFFAPSRLHGCLIAGVSRFSPYFWPVLLCFLDSH